MAFIKKAYSKEKILETSSEDFAFKLLLIQKEIRLYFYAKIAEITLLGRKKLWETIDERMKIFLDQVLIEDQDEYQQDSFYDL